MITFLIAPEATWKQPVHLPQKLGTPPAMLDRTDQAIIETLRRHGFYGQLTWSLLDEVAETQNPQSRTEARQIRLDLWQRLRRLIKARVVFRFTRGRITLTNLPKPPVNRRRRSWGGSTAKSVHAQPRQVNPEIRESLHTGFRQVGTDQQADAKTKIADLNPSSDNFSPNLSPGNNPVEALSRAARELAKRPRGIKRRWTGFAGATRLWRNCRLVLPKGNLVYCYGAVRQRVIWTSRPTGQGLPGGEQLLWDVIPASQVSLAKDPNAVLLGRAKLGIEERYSEAKVLAARRNGLKPCRPGRRRGRPRLHAAAAPGDERILTDHP